MQFRGTFTLFVVFLLIPLTVGGAYFSYTQARLRVEQLNQVTPLSNTDLELVVRLTLGLENAETVEVLPTPPSEIEPAPTLPAMAVDGATPIPEPTENLEETPVATHEADVQIDPRRVTVLLLGIDQREGETGQFRTDTMMLLSLDPVGKTAALLSIPRDLWVSIPGSFGDSRINTANYIGDNPEIAFPGGGPALAMLTVEKVIGVPIHHYILVNFDAFTTLVDTVGPIEICVKELIDDPKYPDGSYGYLPIRIEPGCQAMEADRLLQYARTRATAGSDFDRAARQQEVILAIREKVTSTGGVRSLLGQATTLWESMSNNIRTDMTLDEIITLALTAQEITDVRTGAIGSGEVLNGTAPDGSEILIPIQTDILALVADLFRPPDAAGAPASPPSTITVEPVGTLDPQNLPLAVREEGAIIALLNGTTIRGRAGNLQQYILGYSLDVGFIGNHSSTDVTNTTIIFYGDHMETAIHLARVLATINGDVPPVVERGQGTRDEGDVLVIVGTDLAVPESPSQ